MPAISCCEVKIGFCSLCSAENEAVARHLLQRKFGLMKKSPKRWSRRPAKAVTEIDSPLPRTLLRVYWKEPRGPQKVCWLVVKFVGKPMGGRPGTAAVPPGTLPPRLTTSNPNPYVISFLLA